MPRTPNAVITTTNPTPTDDAVPKRQTRLRWRLHVLCTPDDRWRGQVLELVPGTTTLGRQDVSWTFADPSLSRQHARLQVAEDGVWLVDDGSRNGTFIAGQRTQHAQLGDGAVLRLGATVLVLEADGGMARDRALPTANLPGQTEQARMMRFEIGVAAAQSLHVLLQGETGTGKEHAALEIHRLSERQGPVVRCNVAAVPPELFETELFGHVANAVPGLTGPRLGRVREAQNGTLLLDDIGELSLPLQAKLLRTLEERAVRPVGAIADVPVDVRFIASSSVDLQRLVDKGKFRRDLLARLRVSTVHMPPLSARRGDLLALADAVCPITARGVPVPWATMLTPDAVQALLLYDWPDNLRMVRGCLTRAHALAQGERVGVEHLGPDVAAALTRVAPGAGVGTREAKRPSASRLRAAVAKFRGNVDTVARDFGVHRRQVYRWLDYAGIDQSELRAARRESEEEAGWSLPVEK